MMRSSFPIIRIKQLSRTITDYIADHFHNENLDLKEVAETVHITPSYVSTTL